LNWSICAADPDPILLIQEQPKTLHVDRTSISHRDEGQATSRKQIGTTA
jgi:hypothetical protein